MNIPSYYRVVSVSERLPDKQDANKLFWVFKGVDVPEIEIWRADCWGYEASRKVTHWLEPISEDTVFTNQEMRGDKE